MLTFKEFLECRSFVLSGSLMAINESDLGYIYKKKKYVAEIIPITGSSGSEHRCLIHIYKCDKSGKKINGSKLRFGIETGDLIEDTKTHLIRDSHYDGNLANVKKEGREYIEKYKVELLCV